MRALSLLSFCVVLAAANPAGAVRAGLDGFTGKTGATCANCHNGGATPGVALKGPMALATGQRGDYVLTITTNAAITGMAVAATDGVALIAGTRTKAKFDELVHATPAAPVSGKITYLFSLTGPAQSQVITLWAVGLSANDDKGQGGDGTATTTMNIVVGTPSTDLGHADGSVADGSVADGGADAGADAGSADLAAADLADPAADASPVTPTDPPSGGCAMGGRGLGLPLPMALVLLVWLARRRRRAAVT